MKQFLLAAREVFEIVLISVFTVFVVRSFLVQPFLVSGASMEPNFSNGNYLLIDEITYRFRVPERGEVVVFRYPNDPGTFYIKRIIGLPGERVVVAGGNVTIYNSANGNGLPLRESYIPESTKTLGNIDKTISDEEYFVMGDNRYYSYDSRSWGPLPKKDLVGLVRLRLLPVSEAQAFNPPQYPVTAN